MSSLKQAAAEGAGDTTADKQAAQSINLEPLLDEGSLNQCSRHENTAGCDWACGHFSLVGSELVQEAEGEKAPEGGEKEGGLSRESVNGHHPLQLGDSSSLTMKKTPELKEGGSDPGVNGDTAAKAEGKSGRSHSAPAAADELSQQMKQAFLTGIENAPKTGGFSEGARLSANQRTQSSPPPDLCQLEKKEVPDKRLEKTSSGTGFSSFWRRPALQLFRKPEEGQPAAPPLKDARPYTSPVSSRATSPTGLNRRTAARTSSAPLNTAMTKSAGSQQAALRSSPSPAQRALFRSPESSPDAFSYFSPHHSHQPPYGDEQSVNAHYLHKTRSEPQQWKQPQPETVIENVEWNMEEEEDGDRRSGGMHHGEPFSAGGQLKNSGGTSGNVGGQSQSIGGRSEKIGGHLGTGEGSGVWGTGKGLESQFSSSPSWMDYSNVTEGQAEGYHAQTNRGQTETHPQNPLSNPEQTPPSLRDSIGDGLRSSVVSGVSSAAEDSLGGSLGATKDGKRKRRRNRGKGRKKALSESSAAAEAGENDSAASDSSSMRGLRNSVRRGILAKGAGGGSQRVGNKIDVHHLAKQGVQKPGSGGKGVTDSQQGGSALLQKAADVTPSSSLILQRAERGVSKSEGGSKLQKGGSSHQNDASSDQSSVNASVSEPREPRLEGDRWQHVVRKVESEEGAQGEDEEDIELVEEENDSDAASEDLSDADDAAPEEASQELTRGTSITYDFYRAPSGGEQSGDARAQERSERQEAARGEAHGDVEPLRGAGFNKWHVVAMLGCSILTAFVGGRLYFEHLRRQEAKRKAEKTCRIPVPFGFGEVEVVEVLRPLVCPKDHRGYV